MGVSRKHPIWNTANLRWLTRWSLEDTQQIQAWLASVSKMDEDDNAHCVWKRDTIFHDWQSAIQAAQTLLLSSSTKLRLHFLHEELTWLVNEGGPSIRLSLSHIFTYPNRQVSV